jgi:hypothetical protein
VLVAARNPSGPPSGRRSPLAVTRLLAAGAALSAAAVLGGCGSHSSSGSGDYRGLPDLGGVRTADGNRALVATYTAGPCDTLPRTRVTETSTVVTISAALPSDCVHGDVRWALKFPLPGGLGAREVRNGPSGPTTAPFDGAVLTDPTHLPTGYRQQSEEQTPDVAGSWTRVWVPAAGTAGDQLRITQSPHVIPTPPGAVVPGSWTVAGLPATVVRNTATHTLTVQWDTRSHTRTSRVAAVQAGATPTLSIAELIAVADTLPSRG